VTARALVALVVPLATPSAPTCQTVDIIAHPGRFWGRRHQGSSSQSPLQSGTLETALSENGLDVPALRTDRLSPRNRSPGVQIYPGNGAGGSPQLDVHNKSSAYLGTIEVATKALLGKI
jgi:hypothetical protein